MQYGKFENKINILKQQEIKIYSKIRVKIRKMIQEDRNLNESTHKIMKKGIGTIVTHLMFKTSFLYINNYIRVYRQMLKNKIIEESNSREEEIDK